MVNIYDEKILFYKNVIDNIQCAINKYKLMNSLNTNDYNNCIESLEKVINLLNSISNENIINDLQYINNSLSSIIKNYGIYNFFNGVGQFLSLFWATLCSLKFFSASISKIFSQLFDMGNRTLPVAALISLSIGAVLALQTGIQLSEYGIQDRIGGIVGVSLCTELAPVMAAILMAGRVGSSITAEISTMSVYEEISALKTMDIDPVKYLVLPRFVACLIALPFLVIYMDLIGWLGGSFVSNMNQTISVSFSAFYNDLSQVVTFSDIASGLIKSIFFSITISITSCLVGLTTEGGPREIGTSVTKSVVASFIAILILDYILTRFLILVGLL